MASRLAWLAGGLGIAGALALRALRRRPAASSIEVAPDARADELRRRLDESRTLVGERDRFEDRELTVDAAEPALGDPEERRRRVHEHGRAAAEEMRRSPTDRPAG